MYERIEALEKQQLFTSVFICLYMIANTIINFIK